MNSARSSSLSVWLTLALDPCTVTLPAFVVIAAFCCVRSLTLSFGMLSYAIPRRLTVAAYLNPVVQLDLPAGVNTDMLQGFPCNIVRLATRLKGLKYRRLVDSSWRIRVQCAIIAMSENSRIFDVYLLETIHEVKHLISRHLGVLFMQLEGFHGEE